MKQSKNKEKKNVKDFLILWSLPVRALWTFTDPLEKKNKKDTYRQHWNSVYLVLNTALIPPLDNVH